MSFVFRLLQAFNTLGRSYRRKAGEPSRRLVQFTLFSLPLSNVPERDGSVFSASTQPAPTSGASRHNELVDSGRASGEATDQRLAVHERAPVR